MKMQLDASLQSVTTQNYLCDIFHVTDKQVRLNIFKCKTEAQATAAAAKV